MSGWIKMGVGLRRHPKVVRIASALKADRLRVVGALHAVWCVFDEHSAEGHLHGYTLAIMDEEIGWRGFSAAMLAVGWLDEDGDGLVVPDYEEHNGPTAKRRALDSQRKGKSRNKSADDPPDGNAESGNVSASDADKTKNREEEKREEKKEVSGANAPSSAVADLLGDGGEDGRAGGKPRLPPCPYEQIVGMYHELLPELPGVRVLDDERRKSIRSLWSFPLTQKRLDGSDRATGAASAVAWIREYFGQARHDDWLMGRIERTGEHKNWRCTLEFLCTSKCIKRVLEQIEVTA